MKIKLIADSICDLTPEQLIQMNVRMVPLTIVKGGVGYKDSLDITPKDIFDYVESGKGACQTTAVNIDEYSRVYSEEFADGYDAILHFTISSELSACCNNAVIAAAEFKNVYVIDTRLLSSGAGWLVIYANKLIESGVDAAEIVRLVQEKIQLSETSFVIDTLHYLYKGGRCSGLVALGANLLNLKPCLELRGGFIEVGKKYRGNIEKVVRQYVTERLKARGDIDLSFCCVSHTFSGKTEFVQSIIELIKELQPFGEIYEMPAGCTISNHCGPNTLGVLFTRK
ncbi:MAG: DegV family protein [Oscillospiraceae bacterium]|jgi:DegV family protein with EDD domain|nr:DegV family protein [Oscillospiraceae bacterium]